MVCNHNCTKMCKENNYLVNSRGATDHNTHGSDLILITFFESRIR